MTQSILRAHPRPVVKSFFERREYRKFRYEAILRSRSKCELCGCGQRGLEIVYVKFLHVFPECALRPDNVKVACDVCRSAFESNWGGYANFYQREDWRKMRSLILQRDGYRCRLCQRVAQHAGDVEIDHVKPKSIYPELALSAHNLRPLCRPCNQGKGAEANERAFLEKMIEDQIEKSRVQAEIFVGNFRHLILKKVNTVDRETFIQFVTMTEKLSDAKNDPARIRRVIKEYEVQSRLLSTDVGDNFSFNLTA